MTTWPNSDSKCISFTCVSDFGLMTTHVVLAGRIFVHSLTSVLKDFGYANVKKVLLINLTITRLRVN